MHLHKRHAILLTVMCAVSFALCVSLDSRCACAQYDTQEVVPAQQPAQPPVPVEEITPPGLDDTPTQPAAMPQIQIEDLQEQPVGEEAGLLAQEEKVVKAIEIQGNKTIGISTLLSKIKTRVGQEYLQQVVSDDLKRLYNTGFFSDVSVDRQDYNGGFKVIFYLIEKPILDEITFTKIRYFNPRSLASKMQTKEGKFLDNKILKDDVEMIREMYVKKGLTAVSIDPETDIDPVTNKARVHIAIREGPRVKVKRILVEGNAAFHDKRIIKVMKTRNAWFFNAGYLKEEILEEDMARITAFYEKEGYIDATATYRLEDYDTGRVTVVVEINEGKQYFVGAITIEGNEVLSEQEILETMVSIKPDNVFSRDKLDVDISAIRAVYFDRGYIFANVGVSTVLDPDTGKVDVALDAYEGDLAYVNKIEIQGNTRTRDIVIRRELRMHPGEQFDGQKLRRSKQRLRNLGYFEDIGYDISDTAVPNEKDLVVQVKEAKTGTFSFGGGYSTIDQVVGFIELEQKNFDFTNWPTFVGGGQHLAVRAEAGSTRNTMRLSFTEPWIFDYPVSGGFDIYRTKRLREEDIGYAYDEERLGGDIRFGKQFSEYVSAGTSYQWEEITIDNLADNVSSALAKEAGTNIVSSIGFHATRDTRDSTFEPTRGLLLNGTTEIAGGPLGGDKDFFKIQTKASYNIPLMFRSVLEFRLRTGFADAYGDSEDVPIFERFFAGGAYTIRGYNERKVGPLDAATEDPVGGEGMMVGNIEYLFPLIDAIKVAAFLDMGNVWSKIEDFGTGSYKAGTGLGLRIKTPIGPVNLDYGYPLDDEPGEEDRTGKFYFSISRGF